MEARSVLTSVSRQHVYNEFVGFAPRQLVKEKLEEKGSEGGKRTACSLVLWWRPTENVPCRERLTESGLHPCTQEACDPA
jgi:hypothetical protein